MKQVSVAEAKEVIERGGNTRIIDVRSPAEFRGSHIAEAENVPLDQISGESLDLKAEKGDRIFLICQSGVRSAKASEKLRSLGYSEAVSIEGGMNAWEARGYGAEKGKKTISIERQVRIAAGSLVVVGAILGVLVNLWFVGISAFVGAGLVFAGVTDTCGMGMMLSRMPWNR